MTADLVVLRATWDYTDRLDEFLAWCDSVPALANPVPVIRWNTDKSYLVELAARGVAVVPTEVLEPGDDPVWPEGEFVVKPAIGAGSRDAQRFGREETDDAARHALHMLNERRSVLLQPYLSRVDELGETALIFFEGEFSHAIRKGPLLKRKEGPTTELFAKETITARVPDAAELRVGGLALKAMPFPTPLYARVDLIRDQKGEPVVLELELIEPSLFFPFADRSAEKFAAAVVGRAKGSSPKKD